jgi:putative oxidoreductase
MFMKALEPYTYALLRIFTGFLFAAHGGQKLFSYPVEGGATGTTLYIAGPIELFGGLLVMVGLFTSYTAFLCSGLMAAAYWMAHGLNSFWPIANRGELAVIYCFIFLFMASRGSGIWSVDALLGSTQATSGHTATSR